jgi:predicted dehydrogenase
MPRTSNARGPCVTKTRFAIIGCGFVADYYMTTLANHPGLALAGVWDRDAERLREFSAFHQIKAYGSLDDVLRDESVAIIANLTTPESHFEISKAAILAKKHVYSEKPLALSFLEARDLIGFASNRHVTLCSAPANGLSDAHKLVSANLDRIGAPRLVYAEMEDGPVFREKWQTWQSKSGAKWPGMHEFEVGCTLEHAGYALSWLVSLFGPVAEVTAFSALTFPDKGEGSEGLSLAADFSVGCLLFKSGMVARLTSGFAAPRDRSLTILGDQGSITVRDLWDNRSAVHLEETSAPRPFAHRLARRLENALGRTLPFKQVPGRRLPYPKTAKRRYLPNYPSKIDFMAGVAAQAEMIASGETAVFSGALALHITEIALALHAGDRQPQPYHVKSGFD